MHGKRNARRVWSGDTTITVGVVGTTYGVGTTTISISLGVYLSNILHYKVAVLEYNQSTHFDSIKTAAQINYNDVWFTVSKTDFYPRFQNSMWVQLQKMEYQYIIIDYGEFGNEHLNQYVRNNYLFIVGSLCEWKRRHYLKCTQVLQDNIRSIYYLVLLGTSYDIRSFYKETKIQLYSFPYVYDPFLIVKELAIFWSQFSLY